MSRRAAPPLALYLHLPWCVRKCPYCDFNSHALSEALPEQAYLDALLRDLDFERAAAGERALISVFIGGGTPSLFSGAAIARLLDAVRARFALAPGCEITLEANPGTVEAERFAAYREAGVNRLSIGVQSFDDALLRGIGRIHDGACARRAVRAAGAAGFERVNVDLMFGLPGQSPRDALADLDAALALGPAHLSHYQLTIEPNTRFHRHPPELPPEQASWRMQERCRARLARAGYRHYEVSAFARPGAACRHNRNYWRFGDYLGIGAGAHGKLTEPGTGAVVRTRRPRSPRAYMAAAAAGAPCLSRRRVPRAELAFEFMLNALRLTDGFPLSLLTARTGLPPEAVAEPLAAAAERGLLERRGAHLQPTALGRRFLDDLVAMFLPAGTPDRAAG